MKKDFKKNLIFHIFLLPLSIPFLIFLLYPIIRGLFISFYSTRLGELDKRSYIGFDNFWRLFYDPMFWSTIRTTLSYAFFTVMVTLIVSMAIALLMRAEFKGVTIFRALITIPWAIPSVAAILIWYWILDAQFGVLNYFLNLVGFSSRTWLNAPETALFTVIMVSVWKTFPFVAITFLAGLQGIPVILYEAANIDGASFLQKFIYITIPSMKKVILAMSILITMWALRRFEIIWLLTQGGPDRTTETLSISVYQNAFRSFQMGYASAIGITGIIISFAIIFAYFFVLRKVE